MVWSRGRGPCVVAGACSGSLERKKGRELKMRGCVSEEPCAGESLSSLSHGRGPVTARFYFFQIFFVLI